MKKIKKLNLRIIIFVIILATLVSILVKSNNYVFLYLNPNNNTDVYPYISKSSNEINQILNNAARLFSEYIPSAKILYTNGYGSGFLKNNVTASDYDYGAGLYIGTYQYDGKNEQDIANEILKATALYQANIYSIVKNQKTDFYIQRLSSDRILGINNSQDEDSSLMATSIKQAMTRKPYKIQVGDSIFFMDPNEIVFPNYNFIKLYNKDISYYKGYRKMLRELTITIDYYCNITDTRTNKTYPIEIVASVGNGLRLYQPEFKYFVPNVYTNIKSTSYVSKIMPKLNDDEYIKVRLGNYFHHYELLTYGAGNVLGSPLKCVKRLLQCSDIIAPILPKDVVNKIKEYAYSIISSPTIAELNDYYIANGILYNITKATSLYEDLEKNKEVTTHIHNMEVILKDMINDPQLSYDELKPMFEYQRAITNARNNISELQDVIHKKYWEISQYTCKLMYKKMPNGEKITEYSKYLNKVLEVGGIYNIKFYKDKPEHIYVFADNFTKRLSLEEIKNLDIKNGSNTTIYNSNTKFEFKNPNDFYGNTQDIEYGWVRYKTNKLQDTIYEEMVKQLLGDKNNYHLRIRAGMTR